MPRIKIDIPQNLLATVVIPVRITDINYGNHVGNDAFVTIIHEARMQWLRSHGYTELNIENAGLIMSDICIEFKNESFYGDDVVVEISVSEITRVGFEMYYHLSTQRNNESIVLAKAKTGMVCYNYEAGKVMAIPEKLLHLLKAG